MKQGFLMRLLFCKIHCPFICFCKPSAAAHIYTSSPHKLENNNNNNNNPQHLVVSPGSVGGAVADHASESDSSSSFSEDKEEEDQVINGDGLLLKSCFRKIHHCDDDQTADESKEKKKVKWMDNLGKELVEIKEFESSESGDTDDEEGGSHCLCLIL